tara:strand:+ start:196 stop:507 length:312 start_codon:yes stop_codon:yes gene_type:complete
MKKQDEQFEILRAIDKKSNMTQRDLSNTLGFSLGKINYCLNALKDKGLIKIGNFSKSTNKIKYAYVLTPKGIAEKTKLTYNFLKRKMREYEELQSDLKKLKKK